MDWSPVINPILILVPVFLGIVALHPARGLTGVMLLFLGIIHELCHSLRESDIYRDLETTIIH